MKYQKYSNGQLETVEITGSAALIKKDGKTYNHEFTAAGSLDAYVKQLKSLGFRKVGK